MRIDYARGCFSDNELEAAYVRREWRRTTSTFAVTIVILIAALTVLASLCESDATWYLPFVSTCASVESGVAGWLQQLPGRAAFYFFFIPPPSPERSRVCCDGCGSCWRMCVPCSAARTMDPCRASSAPSLNLTLI